MNFIIVFIFGVLGGLSRYELNVHLPKLGQFPISTLLINLVGCYCFTFLIKNYLTAKNAKARTILALGTGYIGTFTTFSSFMMDSDNLLTTQHYWLLTLYVLLTVGGGLAMAALGMYHGRHAVAFPTVTALEDEAGEVRLKEAELRPENKENEAGENKR
ncbi:chromosome condensation protein CrcB [Lactococcus hircilactis]|uniref:Fluoride-specific ion channel FluC n=1 Tax=Lactococcus hircilactis TaxID=1494462 RepID=A0A7X1Z7E6_9LACT|nr:CrcB family protein [Lactococcus hircilactis]MQW39155.1 chromosome condensation protein CrcB [Lactococcus hircilactis]